MYAKIVARTWSDANFKAKLMSNPQTALAEYNIEIPDGTTVQVVEDTKNTRYLVLPPPPEDDLSDEDLDKAAVETRCCPCCGG